MKNELPVRKKNRLVNYDYSSSGAYFLTICTKDRVNLFWNKCQPDPVGEDIILPPDEIQLSIYGRITEHAVRAIPEHYAHIKLDHYVIMPNHIHLLLSLTENNTITMGHGNTLTTILQNGMKTHFLYDSAKGETHYVRNTSSRGNTYWKSG